MNPHSFIIPNFPQTTKWLTDEQKAYALYRLKNDADEDDDNKSTSIWQGLRLCLTDYRTYIFVLLQHLSILSQTFQYLFPSIVLTLGYGRIQTLLLTVPVWFATWLSALAVTWSADRTADRSIHIICLLTVSAVGNAIVGGTTSVGARFFGMFLMPMGAVSAFQIIVAWIANSFIRPMVKRSAAIAICNAVGNCASIYGTYFYPGGRSTASNQMESICLLLTPTQKAMIRITLPAVRRMLVFVSLSLCWLCFFASFISGRIRSWRQRSGMIWFRNPLSVAIGELVGSDMCTEDTCNQRFQTGTGGERNAMFAKTCEGIVRSWVQGYIVAVKRHASFLSRSI